MSSYKLIEAEKASDLWEKINELQKTEPNARLLSAPEVADLRVETAISALGTQNLTNMRPNFHDGSRLTEAIIKRDQIGVWKERLTTSTHMIRLQEGHQFIHNLHINPGNKKIHDGGIPYGDLKTNEFKPGKLVSNDDYRKSPGGCFRIQELVKHSVFRALLDENLARITEYGRILEILSHVRVSSRGKESIWCPQDLRIGDGRAWALGLGGDSAYPPNATTNNHWGLVYIQD